VLLTSLVQGVAIRWALGARDFDLRNEGLRLLEVQCRLLAVEGE
jgi:TetR/AcrR family transcriptional regulator